jgi:uncharacterized protein (TIGR02266 family)
VATSDQPRAHDVWARLIGLARAVDARSYYQLLGVTMDAAAEELRRRYLERSALVDAFPRARSSARADRNALFLLKARLREAYDVLVDPALRQRYNDGLAHGELRLPESDERPAREIDRVREEPRSPFSALVRVSCARWADFLALHANNISQGGLFVRTPTPLERGSAVKLRIVLPQQFTLELDAEVVRLVRGPSPGMGLRFKPMDDFRKSIVERLVREARELAAAAAMEAIESIDDDDGSIAADEGGDDDGDSVHDVDDDDVLGMDVDLGSLGGAPTPAELGAREEPASPSVIDDERETTRYERAVGTPGSTLSLAELFARPRTVPEGESDRHDLVAEARALLAARQFSEARAKFAAAVRDNTRDPSLRAGFHLAAAYEAREQGRHDDAHEHFERVLIYDKDCREAIRELRH